MTQENFPRSKLLIKLNLPKNFMSNTAKFLSFRDQYGVMKHLIHLNAWIGWGTTFSFFVFLCMLILLKNLTASESLKYTFLKIFTVFFFKVKEVTENLSLYLSIQYALCCLVICVFSWYRMTRKGIKDKQHLKHGVKVTFALWMGF